MKLTDICTKCGLRYIGKPFKSYDRDICWICYLKSVGFYKLAAKEIGGWFDWSTDLSKLPLGWSFAEEVQWCKVLMCVLKSVILNKTPKIPVNSVPQDYGWTDWQVQISNAYYKKY